MMRQVIKIDEEKCSGCGLCAAACHEGAIAIVDGKARLVRDDYCDGMGDCLPGCPTGAISFELREAADQDGAALPQSLNWPVQIRLAPIQAPWLKGAELLVAADCTAYAHANFYSDFIKDRAVLIGCPKLDNTDYCEKMTEIIKNNDIRGILLARMEVPCCGGLVAAVQKALQNSRKDIPLNIVTISIRGEIVS